MDLNRLNWIIPSIFGIFIVLYAFFDSDLLLLKKYDYDKTGDYSLAYIQSKDTLFCLGNSYIEISIKEQRAKLFQRNDSVISYRISTGNQFIKEGQSTPEGLFTVQNKSPMAISKQFDNAELFNWIGFNGNVGFHGLKGTGYYRTLGFKPSSHGCVRISREDGQSLYGKVRTGTPVIVYYNDPLRVIKFAKVSDFNPEYDFMIQGSSYSISKLLNSRIENIYNGLALKYNSYRIFSDGRYILKRSFIQNGTKEKVPLIQKISFTKRVKSASKPDNLVYKPYYIISDLSKIDFH